MQVAIDVPWNDSGIYDFPSDMTAPEYMEPILGLHPGDAQRGLEDLGSLIEYKDDSTVLRVLHASLFDFLSDPARFLDLPFNLAAIDADLAIWYSYLDPHHDNVQIEELEGESNILHEILLLCVGELLKPF